jgi:hypothetical protein
VGARPEGLIYTTRLGPLPGVVGDRADGECARLRPPRGAGDLVHVVLEEAESPTPLITASARVLVRRPRRATSLTFRASSGHAEDVELIVSALGREES